MSFERLSHDSPFFARLLQQQTVDDAFHLSGASAISLPVPQQQVV